MFPRCNLRDQAIDSEEVVTPLMLDGTYLSRNFATLGPMIRPSNSLKPRSLLDGVNVGKLKEIVPARKGQG